MSYQSGFKLQFAALETRMPGLGSTIWIQYVPELNTFINSNLNCVLHLNPFINQILKKILNPIFYESEPVDSWKTEYPFVSLGAYLAYYGSRWYAIT